MYDYLSRVLKENDTDVALQETHAVDYKQAVKYKINGYELIATMNDAKYGFTTYIRHGLKMSILEESRMFVMVCCPILTSAIEVPMFTCKLMERVLLAHLTPSLKSFYQRIRPVSDWHEVAATRFSPLLIILRVASSRM